MNRSLIIDRGNTTLKASVFQGDKCLCQQRIELTDDIACELRKLTAEYRPSAAIYSSVVPNAEIPESLIREITGSSPLIFTHNTPIPIKIAYETPQTLGLDRIAAAVGAQHIVQKDKSPDFLLTIDAGTAVTIDLTDNNGHFAGGNISAGLSMRLHALHEYTGALPEVDSQGEVQDFGTNTTNALRSGAVNGITAEIERACDDACRRCGNNGRLILTGGDADIIAKHLNNKIQTIKSPELVAIGLNYILHYNEHKD